MRILIIDDDKFIRTIYESELKKGDFAVDTASNGNEGITKMRTSPPDLLILDMLLPIKDGFTVLEEIHADAQLSKIPVVVISGLSQQKDIDDAFALGATKYLPKDKFSVAQTIEEVHKLLAQ